ncbi:MAG: hypothetical protein ACIALR_04500 [Blastopirellula sp. JB062]
MPLKSLLLMIGAGWIMLGTFALGPGLIVYPLAWAAVAVGFWALHFFCGDRISGITASAAIEGTTPDADGEQSADSSAR